MIHPFHIILIRKAILRRQGFPVNNNLETQHVRVIEEIGEMPSHNTLLKLVLMNDVRLSFSKDTLNRIVWYLTKRKNDILPNERSIIENYWTTFKRYFPIPEYYNSIVYTNLKEVPDEMIQNMNNDVKSDLENIDIRNLDITGNGDDTYPEIEQVYNGKYPQFANELPGLYYSYFTDTKTPCNLVRVISKIEMVDGKLKFEYKTQNQKYETIYFDIEDDRSVFVRLRQCSYPKIHINFNLKYENDILIGHYSTYDKIHQKNSIAGMEIFIKQNFNLENEEKFTSKKIFTTDNTDNEIERELLKFSRNKEFQPNFTKRIIESVHDIIELNKQNDFKNHLQLRRLFEFNWCLFYLHEHEKLLVRSILEFKDTGEVILKNIPEQDSGETNIFKGSMKYKNNILIIDLKNDNENKPLQIISRIGNNKYDLIVGMWHDVDESNAIIGGTTIIQCNESKDINTPEIYRNFEEASKTVLPEIINFFNNKSQNITKVSSKIYSIASLKFFLNEQKEKIAKDDRVYHEYDHYIGTQIFTMGNWNEFSEFKQNICDIIVELRLKHKRKIFWPGEYINSQRDYEIRITNVRANFIEILENSKSYIAIIENTLSTGLFSELSIAIISGKPCIVITKKSDFIPYMIKNLMTNNRIKSIPFSDYKDILPILDDLI